MTISPESKQRLTLPSEREILITRWFAAPPSLLWRAHTDAALIPQWWGPAIYTTVVDAMELRVGGKWRYVQTAADGGEHAFRGEYKEILPEERLVYTFEYEPMAGHIILETATFKAMDGGTLLTMHALFDNQEDRDGMIASGMEEGQSEGWDRLAAVMPALDAEYVITRDFAVPRRKLWEAFTQADKLARWWGPKGLAMEHVALDLRPGGLFHYGMRANNGAAMWGRFVYRDIVPQESVTFVNSFSDANGGLARHPAMLEWPMEMLIQMTFEDNGDGSRLVMRSFPINANPQEIAVFKAGHSSMDEGNGGMLDNLDAFLSEG